MEAHETQMGVMHGLLGLELQYVCAAPEGQFHTTGGTMPLFEQPYTTAYDQLYEPFEWWNSPLWPHTSTSTTSTTNTTTSTSSSTTNTTTLFSIQYTHYDYLNCRAGGKDSYA